MFKKSYLFLTLLTALLLGGTGTMWGAAIEIDADHPYSNNFESNIDGFSKVGYSSATITKNSTSGKVNGTYALRVYTYGTNNVVLIFPEFDDALENLSVSFYAARTYNATTSIGYITNVSNASTFVSKQSFSCSTGIGGPYSYDFSTAGSIPAGARIAISYSGQSSKSSYLFIDDLTVTSTTTASACKKPKNLTQGTVTTTSASFTWAQGASEEAWQYVCLPASATLDWTGAETANSETATVSGLTAGTAYKFYVRSDCGSEQSSPTSAQFKTVYGLPFTENFTGLTFGIPEGWDNSEGTTTTETYKWSYYNAGYGAAPCLRFNSYSNGYKTNFLKTPTIYVDKAATLSFAYKNPKGGAMDIYYTIDGGSQQTLKTGYPQVSNWTEYDEELPAACIGHNVQIIFKGTSNNGSGDAYLYLDDISVTEASSCAKPTVVNASAASDSKINLSWTKGDSETQWNVQYSSDGGTSWTAVNNIATTVDGANCSASLTGLAEQTTYQIQVQADCGGALSKWVSFGGVPTPCAAKSFPFSEDFTGLTSGNIPECWNNSEGTTTTASSKWVYYSSGHNAAPSVRFNSYSNSNGNTNFLKTPNVAVTENAVLNFWYKNPNGGDFSVYYSIDGAERVLLASGLTGQTDWKEASYPLPAAAVGHNVMIIFKGTSNYESGDAYLYLDEVEIKAAPSCMAPSAVSGSATAYNTASISWTENNSATAWKLHYSSDNGISWSEEISVSENPYLLTGLSEKSNYIVEVKSVCGVSEFSDWSASSDIIPTPCAPVDASDFSETFESATVGSGNLPDCWQYKDVYTNWGDDYPYVYNSGAYQGSKMLYFYGGGATSVNTVLLPQMDETLDGLTVEFYYSTSVNVGSVVYAVPVLGYIAADGTTFVEIETLAQSADYVLYKKDLSSVPATAKYLAIRYANGTAGSGHMYLDNVRVYPTPNCLDPTSVTVSNVTATTADVAWTENNGKSTWKLQISNNGSAWTDVNGGADITANPYTLTGLTPNHTTYYVRVKTICGVGDESPWSAASEPFETKCAASALPFNDDFSGADLGCWTKEHCYSSTGLNNGTFRFFYNNTWASEVPPQYLISPEIDTDSKEVTVEFDYYVYGSTYPETFHVGYSSTTKEVAAFTWGAEVTATNTSTNVLHYSENLPAGVKYIAIKHTSDDQYYLYIDNFSVTEYVAPACPAVSAATLEESNVTAHTATVSWTAGGEETAWNLQYKAAGGEWSAVIPVATTPSYDMSGLAENTLYYVRVQANCGENLSDWTGDEAFSFPTDCEPKTVTKAQPWSYDFEATNDGFMPACWERTEPYANYGYPVVAEYSYYAQSGDKYLYLRTPGRSGSSYTEEAILPVFNTEIKNLKVSFSYFNGAATSNYGQLAIGYVVGEAFTQVGDLLAKVDDYTLVEREMPNDAPDGARIAIRCVGSTKGSSYTTTVYVDDIQVSLKPTCYTPTNLQAAETSDGAVLTWTAGKDENEWSVRYSVKDADEWTVVDDEITATNYTLTGLSQNVTYEVQVKAVCGVGDESEWSASVEFTPVCNAPSSLAVTARTMTSATFSWISSESAWVLQYSVDGENWESENVNANPYTLNNLTAGQTYQAKIQAACGSDFSNVVDFTTVCAMRSAADLPFSEDFTGIADYALPACWESATASVESEKLFFRGADEQIVVLPGYDVALNKLSVSFDYTLNNASMQFGYVETIDGEFHSLAELEGTAFEADLTTAPAFAGYLAFRYYNSLSQYAATTIDNVIVMDKSALALKDTEDNADILAELEGETVTITIKRTIFCDGYFNTLCLPFDLDAAALAASPLAGYARLAKFTEATVESGSDELQLVYEYATSIEAGVPYLINFPAGENIVNPTFTNVTISATIGSNANLGNGIIVKGILKPEPFTAGNEDMLFLLGENKLSWAGVTNYLKGFRAYFQLDNVPAGSPVRRGMNARIVERQNMPTGIDNAKFNDETIKRLENNQVVIIRNGVKYNIQGQVISK